MATAWDLVERNIILRLNHCWYAYLHFSSVSGSDGGGGDVSSSSSRRIVTLNNNNASNNNKNGGSAFSYSRHNIDQYYHVFAKSLVLTKLAHFFMGYIITLMLN